ncbi:MAG: glutamate--tRNA ligase [Chloroflexota bacterium]
MSQRLGTPNDHAPARVRFAPSPTGYLHLGGLRTALFNWLYARHTGGQFILRIEDTDQNRFVEDSLDNIMSSLRWLGLHWDEGPDVGGPYGPYTQSERKELYHQYAEQLVDEGYAYRCYCTGERLAEMREEQKKNKQSFGYDRRCRDLSDAEHAKMKAEGVPSVIRLKVPLDGATTFDDKIRGPITIENSQLQDAVLFKSDNMPTYHLAVVVDDHLMEITHIMRSDEWVSSTPLHKILYDAFGWAMPIVAHLPVILDPSGKGKMSKRKKVVAGKEYLALVHEFQDAGFVPSAMFNFLTNVGWNFDAEREIFSQEEAIERFDINEINSGPAALPYDKLTWITGMYIRDMSPEQLKLLLVPYLSQQIDVDEETLLNNGKLDGLIPLIQERMTTLTDADQLVDWAYLDADALSYPEPGKMIGKKLDAPTCIEILKQGGEMLSEIEPFDADTLQATFRQEAEKMSVKVGPFLTPFRVALTGKTVAPPLFESMVVLGREEVLKRIQNGLQALEAYAAQPA